MKVLAILFRVVFSIIVLLLVACYLQSSPTVTFGDFFNSLGKIDFVEMLSGVNGVTISLAVILLLSILTFTRLLEAAWNVLF
ncbi:MAG: hypothetical protein IKA55_05305, partial [Akkermansia sp.]|nr:hypothetical protein [Akkermansia sp.]